MRNTFGLYGFNFTKEVEVLECIFLCRNDYSVKDISP